MFLVYFALHIQSYSFIFLEQIIKKMPYGHQLEPMIIGKICPSIGHNTVFSWFAVLYLNKQHSTLRKNNQVTFNCAFIHTEWMYSAYLNPLNAWLPHHNCLHCPQLRGGCSLAFCTGMVDVWWAIVPSECNRGYDSSCELCRDMCTHPTTAFPAKGEWMKGSKNTTQNFTDLTE